jgi:hypothetical protein
VVWQVDRLGAEPQRVWCSRDHLCVLSAGQMRLRELVEATAREIDPKARCWP